VPPILGSQAATKLEECWASRNFRRVNTPKALSGRGGLSRPRSRHATQPSNDVREFAADPGAFLGPLNRVGHEGRPGCVGEPPLPVDETGLVRDAVRDRDPGLRLAQGRTFGRVVAARAVALTGGAALPGSNGRTPNPEQSRKSRSVDTEQFGGGPHPLVLMELGARSFGPDGPEDPHFRKSGWNPGYMELIRHMMSREAQLGLIWTSDDERYILSACYEGGE